MLVLALAGPMPVAGAAPPDNDAFASAAVVDTLPYEDTVNTREATLQPGEPQPACAFGAVRRTVWYSFTPGPQTFVAADTLGSDFDTVVGVWKGSSLTDLEPVACGDDAIDSDATVTFRAEAGITYYVQVGGFFGDAGSLEFRMREVGAGLIEGTVTEEGTGSPLAEMCVFTFDRDIFSVQFTVTRSDGSYEVAVRPGSHLVAFIDFCDASDDHIAEFYDDVPFSQPENATPVDVAVSVVESGIDAELSPGCPGFASQGALEGFTQVVGTQGPDVLTGTAGDDLICGLRGADVIRGLGGNDLLLGGPGRDRLVGGPGGPHEGFLEADFLDGGPGRDRLVGGPDRDFLRGGSGKDRLLGQEGRDQLIGGGGNDRLFGGPGNDHLNGGPGTDRCVGGPGHDRAVRCEIVQGVERVFGLQMLARAPLRGEHGSRRDLLEAALAPLRD